MQLQAPAKINLGLDILRKREDGYHEVRMIMQTIKMFDILDLDKMEEPGILLTTNIPELPTDGSNLICKAARLLMEEFAVTEGVRIRLEKRIPMAAGMAGGSTDAAATLKGVNELFGLGLSDQELMDRAVRIGADVPYCIMQGTALAEGIGEKLTRIAPVPECYILVGKPEVGVSTKEAYGNLNLAAISSHPDILGMVTDIENKDLSDMVQKMQNVFEPGIIRLHPVIQKIKDLMEANGAAKAMMSGSGPTVFGIFTDKDQLEKAEEILKASGLAQTVYATETLN